MVRDDLVVLDVRDDSYACVPGVPGLRINGRLAAAPRMVLDELQSLGLTTPLRAGVSPDMQMTTPPQPRIGVAAAAGVAPTFGETAAFIAAWLRVAPRRPTVGGLAAGLSARRGSREDLDAIARRVRVFRQLLPLAPFAGECLFQAELLLRFLNAAGLDAALVFGVRTWPFLAHCWLQAGEVCLTDPPDILAMYRPILAV